MRCCASTRPSRELPWSECHTASTARRSRPWSPCSPGASATEDEIREFAKERVAAYEYPRVVRIVQALPMGPTAEIAQARALSPKAVSVGTWAR